MPDAWCLFDYCPRPDCSGLLFTDGGRTWCDTCDYQHRQHELFSELNTDHATS